ncbi:MAG: S41 family peptidase [Casimicrobiaceae bacterium]
MDATSRTAIVNAAMRALDTGYVFPDVARRASALLAANLRAHAYDGIDDPVAFAERLTADLNGATHDLHVRVRYSVEPLPPPGADDDTPSPEQAAADLRDDQRQNFGVARVERLPFNLGYIDLRQFADAANAAPAIAAAMTLVAHTDALIVDLRSNGGGDPACVAFMTSYLFDKRTHLNSLYWRKGERTEQFWTDEWVPGPRFGATKPVYVLTSSRTFSGAEEFSYNLKNLKRATLVGETTGGGANPGDRQQLSPHFDLFVPSGRAVSPITHTNWEGIGVVPDVRVEAADALRVAEVLALRGLLAQHRQGDDATALARRIAELDSRGARRERS